MKKVSYVLLSSFIFSLNCIFIEVHCSEVIDNKLTEERDISELSFFPSLYEVFPGENPNNNKYRRLDALFKKNEKECNNNSNISNSNNINNTKINNNKNDSKELLNHLNSSNNNKNNIESLNNLNSSDNKKNNVKILDELNNDNKKKQYGNIKFLDNSKNINNNFNKNGKKIDQLPLNKNNIIENNNIENNRIQFYSNADNKKDDVKKNNIITTCKLENNKKQFCSQENNKKINNIKENNVIINCKLENNIKQFYNIENNKKKNNENINIKNNVKQTDIINEIKEINTIEQSDNINKFEQSNIEQSENINEIKKKNNVKQFNNINNSTKQENINEIKEESIIKQINDINGKDEKCINNSNQSNDMSSNEKKNIIEQINDVNKNDGTNNVNTNKKKKRRRKKNNTNININKSNVSNQNSANSEKQNNNLEFSKNNINQIKEKTEIIDIISKEKDDINMQHFLHNTIQISKDENNFYGIQTEELKKLFKEDSYKNDDVSSTFTLMNKIIEVLACCSYNSLVEFENNENYCRLKDIFNKITNIDYKNFNNAYEIATTSFIGETCPLFEKACEDIKKANPTKYEFIEGDIKLNIKNRRKIQLELGKIFEQKFKENGPDEFWNSNDILLHNSLLLALYNELLCLEFKMFPKKLLNNQAMYNEYFNKLFTPLHLCLNNYFNPLYTQPIYFFFQNK